MNKLKTITSVISGLLLSASYAYGAGTSAGATITNQASVSYDAGAGTVVASSGSVSFKVQELVKATVAKLDASDISISSPQTDAAMKFKIKNDGNGSEGFKIVVTQDSGECIQQKVEWTSKLLLRKRQNLFSQKKLTQLLV